MTMLVLFLFFMLPFGMVILGPFVAVVPVPVAVVPLVVLVIPIAVLAPPGVLVNPFRMVLVNPVRIVLEPPVLILPGSVGHPCPPATGLPPCRRMVFEVGPHVLVPFQVGVVMGERRIGGQLRMAREHGLQAVFGPRALRESGCRQSHAQERAEQ